MLQARDRRGGLRGALSLGVLVGALLGARPAAGQAVYDRGGSPGDIICPNAAVYCGIVDHPRFVNVYWGMPFTSYAPGIKATGAGITMDRVDAFVQALTASDWITGAQQYGVKIQGVYPSVFIGPQDCPGLPLPTSIGKNSSSPTEAHNLADGLISCLFAMHPEFNGNTVVNLIMGPSVQPLAPWCSSAPKAAFANHEQHNGVSMTFMATSCFNSFGFFTKLLTHEMIEAVTDPYSWGWAEIWSGPYYGEEVADLCQGGSGTAPGTTPTVTFLPNLAGPGGVSTYWDNFNNNCFPADVAATSPLEAPPVLTAAPVVIGSGKQMSFQFTGAFGALFPDIAPNGHSGEGGTSSIYVSALVSGPTHLTAWGAGNFWGNPVEDTAGFSQISMVNGPGTPPTTQVLTVTGFDGFYAPYDGSPVMNSNFTVAPGDQITFSLTSPTSGRVLRQVVTAPEPAAVADLVVVPWGVSLPKTWVFYGDGQVQGTITDGNNGPIEGALVQLATSSGISTPPPTDSGGKFSAVLQTASAGPQTVSLLSPVTASINVDVHPVATSLSAQAGTVAGGQSVTLSGAGFAPGQTTISFVCPVLPPAQPASADATIVQMDPAGTQVQVLTPPSPCGPGMAKVVARVGGVPSVALSYLYVEPGQPMLTFAPGCELGGHALPNSLKVSAYQADGTKEVEAVLLSATYPAFAGGASTIQVTTDATTSLVGTGPVTATVVGNPGLTTTRTFVEPPLSQCVSVEPPVVNQLRFPQEGPVEGVVVDPSVVAGLGAIWALPGSVHGELPRGFVQLLDSNPGAVASDLVVRSLSVGELSSTLGAHPFAVQTDRTRWELTGTAVSVGVVQRYAQTGGARSAPSLRGAFRGEGNQPTAVFWLGDADGSEWLPVQTTRMDPNQVTYSIPESGTYMLAVPRVVSPPPPPTAAPDAGSNPFVPPGPPVPAPGGCSTGGADLGLTALLVLAALLRRRPGRPS